MIRNKKILTGLDHTSYEHQSNYNLKCVFSHRFCFLSYFTLVLIIARAVLTSNIFCGIIIIKFPYLGEKRYVYTGT